MENPIKDQIGNFLIEEISGDLPKIRVRTVVGDWETKFQLGTAMFSFIPVLLETNREVLHAMMVMWYESCVIIPDGDLMMVHRKAYDEYYDRIPREELTEEEDQEILDELKRLEEIDGEETGGGA